MNTDKQKFAIELLSAIDNGDELSDGDIRTAIDWFGVYNIHGHDRRWSRMDTEILEICDRWFSIDVDYALTENQETEFYQPKEIEFLGEEIITRKFLVKKWVDDDGAMVTIEKNVTSPWKK